MTDSRTPPETGVAPKAQSRWRQCFAFERPAQQESVAGHAYRQDQVPVSGRQEPAFGQSDSAGGTVPPFYNAGFNDGNARCQALNPKSDTAVSRLSRILLLIGVFAIGAATGMLATWWFNQSVRPHSVNVAASRTTANASMPKSRNDHVEMRPGISPDELPYDGHSPMLEQRMLAATSTSGASPGATPPTVETSKPLPVPSIQTEQEATTALDESTRVATTRQSIPTAQKTAKASQRNRIVQKTAKDREIERMKQQASEELKKKIDNQRLTAESRARISNADRRQSVQETGTYIASRNASKRAQLERCEQASNFILREQCKWEICSGTWGKNGCPSYER